jgi:tetratricopeptide (TPR) repeat protein
MIGHNWAAAPVNVLDAANAILTRAKKAHDSRKFARADNLYSRAILMLKAEWEENQDVNIAKRLAFAIREGSYPCYRKFYSKRCKDRDEWGQRARERSKNAANLERELMRRDVLDAGEVVEAVVHLQTLCAELSNQGYHRQALEWISKTYDTWRRYGEPAPLDERLLAVLKYYEARCYLKMDAYSHALTCIDEALRTNTMHVQLLDLANALREEIVAAQNNWV